MILSPQQLAADELTATVMTRLGVTDPNRVICPRERSAIDALRRPGWAHGCQR